jgi:predicted nucleotidyltransferase
MNIDSKYIFEIVHVILMSEDVKENNWESLSFVFDVADSHIANSGFLYTEDKIRPAVADIDHDPLILDDKIIELREKVFEQCNAKFKQLLIQMEKGSGRIKIDFEFDNPSRWSITPANMKQIREELRPYFN